MLFTSEYQPLLKPGESPLSVIQSNMPLAICNRLATLHICSPGWSCSYLISTTVWGKTAPFSFKARTSETANACASVSFMCSLLFRETGCKPFWLAAEAWARTTTPKPRDTGVFLSCYFIANPSSKNVVHYSLLTEASVCITPVGINTAAVATTDEIGPWVCRSMKRTMLVLSYRERALRLLGKAISSAYLMNLV